MASSGVSSIVTIRSFSGRVPKSAAKSVVFPLPVAPVIRMLCLFSKCCTSSAHCAEETIPRCNKSLRECCAGRRRRSEMVVPWGAIAGNTACSRIATCSSHWRYPSAHGWASSSRVPADCASETASSRQSSSLKLWWLNRWSPGLVAVSAQIVPAGPMMRSVSPSRERKGAIAPSTVSCQLLAETRLLAIVSPFFPNTVHGLDGWNLAKRENWRAAQRLKKLLTVDKWQPVYNLL